MIAKHFDIIDCDSEAFYLQYLKSHSIAFRKMYKNINLLDDKEFIDLIIERYVKSLATYRILKIEVEAAYSRDETDRMEKLDEIEALNKLLVKDKIRGKRKKEIQRQISFLESSVKKGITFGGKTTLKKINHFSDAVRNFVNLDKKRYKQPLEFYERRLEELRQEFSDKRIRCATLHGDSGKKGNRFFDFSKIDQGILIFKPENHDRKKVELRFKFNKNMSQTLSKLKVMSERKEIPITVTFGVNGFSLIYDVTKLNGTFNDMKPFYKTIKHIKAPELRKPMVAAEHRRHETLLFKDRNASRYGSIDANPNGIGFVITERLSDSPEGDFRILKKQFFDFTELNRTDVSSNKRNYELSIIVRDMFNLMEHHKVCHFVTEDLSLPPKDYGNKSTNRQINNVWCRTRIDQMITNRCNLFAIKRITINPAYSSFIGNIKYNEFDPIAAAIEIARRGMIKFIKDSHWLPEFHKGSITEITDCIGDEMDDAELLNLRQAGSWKDAFSVVKSSDFSVRRTNADAFCYQVNLQNRTGKSKVRILDFQ